jgi:hypothetical protein
VGTRTAIRDGNDRCPEGTARVMRAARLLELDSPATHAPSTRRLERLRLATMAGRAGIAG